MTYDYKYIPTAGELIEIAVKANTLQDRILRAAERGEFSYSTTCYQSEYKHIVSKFALSGIEITKKEINIKIDGFDYSVYQITFSWEI